VPYVIATCRRGWFGAIGVCFAWATRTSIVAAPSVRKAPNLTDPPAAGHPCTRADRQISAVDYFPTIASLASVAIPEGTLLRGSDISAIWHGKVNHLTTRPRPLFWRGGGGPPPCWNRSPGLAVRNGDWKLLFSPNNGSDLLRVELFNMSIAGLQHTGAFFESQNQAAAYPEVVRAMVAQVMPWHTTTPIPFGASTNTDPTGDRRFQPSGCEQYPFPGLTHGGGPDGRGNGMDDARYMVTSNEAGGDAAAALDYESNLARQQHRQAQQHSPPPQPGDDHHGDGAGSEEEVARLRAEVTQLKAELQSIKQAAL
jgi:hypothetical protein